MRVRHSSLLHFLFDLSGNLNHSWKDVTIMSHFLIKSSFFFAQYCEDSLKTKPKIFSLDIKILLFTPNCKFFFMTSNRIILVETFRQNIIKPRTGVFRKAFWSVAGKLSPVCMLCTCRRRMLWGESSNIYSSTASFKQTFKSSSNLENLCRPKGFPVVESKWRIPALSSNRQQKRLRNEQSQTRHVSQPRLSGSK